MKAIFRLTVPVALLVVSPCCDKGRDGIFEARPQALPPVQLESSIAYVSKTLEKAQFVSWDGEGDSPVVTSVDVGRAPFNAHPSSDLSKLFVICHGAQEGEVRQRDVEEESLHVIEPGAGGTDVYEIGNPFNALSESASGRWAILYFESMIAGTNPNLLAVVDLEAPPSETNPVVRSIRTLGSIPLAVIIAEDIDVQIEGGGHLQKNLALVLSNSYITLFDLENIDRSEITIPLVVPEEGIEVVPIEEDVIISNDPEGLNSRIVLRSDNSSDIFSVTFVGVDAGDPAQNDYRVSLNQLSVDVNPHDAPTDMALFEDAGRKLVLVTTATSDSFAVVDPETTMVTTVSVEYPIGSTLIYDDGRMAMLYTIGQRMGYFLELAQIETEKERNLREYSFGDELASFVPVPQRDFVVMMVQGESNKLFFLDLVGQQMDLVNLFGYAFGTQFLMYPGGEHILISPDGLDEVWFVKDMESYQIDRIILDYPVHDVWLLSAGSPDGKIVLDHNAPEGFLTFLDMDDPKRSGATSIRGFLVRGVMRVDPGNYPLSGR